MLQITALSFSDTKKAAVASPSPSHGPQEPESHVEGEGLGQSEVRPPTQCSRCSRAGAGRSLGTSHQGSYFPLCFSPLHSSGLLSHCPAPPAPAFQHKCLTPLKDIKRSWASATYLTPKYPCQARACLLLGTKVTG